MRSAPAPGTRDVISGGAASRPSGDEVRSLVACIAAVPPPEIGDLARGACGAGWLRVEAGAIGDLPRDWLQGRFPGRLIYSLRGEGLGDLGRRDRLLRALAAGYDLVELDGERDLRAEILEEIPPNRRLLAWRGPAANAAALAGQFRRLSGVPARFYVMTIPAGRVQDALAPLELLRIERRPDLVAYAEGNAGLWGRVLSATLGAPLIFGSLAEDGTGEPTLARLVEDFGLPVAPKLEHVYGIVGGRVAHSLSPRVHNAAYRALGLPSLFLPFPVATFEDFWRDMSSSEDTGLGRIGLPLKGLTVASPHKEFPTEFVPAASRTARHAASANLVYRRSGDWFAETTDPDGVLSGLRRRGLGGAGCRAAVVGCGGSGRAIAAALREAGARVVLCNRGRHRGEQASLRLGLPFVPLATFDPSDHDLIVNATPVGLEDEEPPFSVSRLPASAVVVDLVYARDATPLVSAAKAAGLRVIDGREVLLIQAARQFELMTGRKMPERLAASLLGLTDLPGAPAIGRRHVSRRSSWGIRPVGCRDGAEGLS